MTRENDPKKLGVFFPPGLDPYVWDKKYEGGQVPDRWPYGLHRLKEYGNEVVPVEANPMGLRGKASLAARLLHMDKPFRSDGELDIGISWDEYTAAKMVVQRPSAAMYTGVIWATDTWSSEAHKVRGAISKRMLMGLTGLWCLSRAQAYETERQLKNRVPVDYLPFGIDVDFFNYTNPPIEQRVLSLGVDRDRDPKTLFEALELVHRACPQAELLVQTDSKSPLPPGVTRLDRVPHAVLRDLYRATSVVLVPTKHNLHVSGMTVALEAGASGRPVVACSTPGMEDYVLSGRTGLTVPTGDHAAMAEATLEILNDREMAMSMGREARSHVGRSHRSDQMVRNIKRIISRGA